MDVGLIEKRQSDFQNIDMNENLDIIGFVIGGAVVLYIFIKTSKFYLGNKYISKFIVDYYTDLGMQTLSISRLNVTERIKYGVPISIFWLYNYYFGFLSGKIIMLRKVEVSNNDKEYINYVELQVKNNEIISFKEFESFEY